MNEKKSLTRGTYSLTDYKENFCYGTNIFHQFGLRENHCTIDQVHGIAHTIGKAIEQ